MRQEAAAKPAYWSAFALLLASAALGGCSALQVISDTSPSGHYTVNRDIAYGPEPRQALDDYLPLDESAGAPLVVFFYGGGWRDGERGRYEFVASALTKAGYRVLIPDYRSYPEVRFPAFVEDAAAAVAWALQQEAQAAPALHDDVTKAPARGVYLAGHSAGAHIAALLATDPHYLQAHDISQERLAGLIGLSGPYDFLPIESGYLLEVFPEASRAASQPINFVNAGVPPALLIHGQDDEVVKPGNSERFGQALEAAGVPVTVTLYPGTGHAAVAAALAPRLAFLANTLDDVIAFIRRRETERAREQSL